MNVYVGKIYVMDNMTIVSKESYLSDCFWTNLTVGQTLILAASSIALNSLNVLVMKSNQSLAGLEMFERK